MSVLAMVCLATSIYAASLVPFLLLVDADDLNPLHHAPAWLRGLPLTFAALRLILGGTNAR